MSTFYSSDVFAGRSRNSNKRFASSGKNSRRQVRSGTSSASVDTSSANNYSNLLATVKMLSNRIDELEKKLEEKNTSNSVDLRVVDLENRVRVLENNGLNLDEVKLTDEQQEIVKNFRYKYMREGLENLTYEEAKSQLPFLSDNQIKELFQRINDAISLARLASPVEESAR